jgi:DNA repair exonuclease SbcCD ATPase subunit
VDTPTADGAKASVCALAGCEVAVVQPAGGGRRRLYCSNAHRAEARRKRLVETPDPSPGDLLGPALGRLAAVLDDLRGYETTLRSIDPGVQAMEIARIRAESTAEVLAAQQAGAKAAEEAARSSERLAAERTGWEVERTALRDEVEELRAAGAAATERATSAQDALEAALAAHRAELDERDHLAARAAAAHEQEASRLAEQLDQSRTAASAAQARAEAADHRAASADQAARQAAERAAGTEASMNRLQVEVAKAEAAVESANQRAASAERLLEQARADLQSERDESGAMKLASLGEVPVRPPRGRGLGRLGGLGVELRFGAGWGSGASSCPSKC